MMEVLMNNTEFFELRAFLERIIEDSLKCRETKKYLTIKDVAHFTSLSVSTIRRAVAKGELKVSRAAGKLLFQSKWIDKWLIG